MNSIMFQKANKIIQELKSNNIINSDFDLSSNMESYNNSNVSCGFRIYKQVSKMKLKINNCQPKEANSDVVFEIDQGFNSKQELLYYRYAIAWEYDCMQSLREGAREDYVSEACISLRRSIRFDFEPHLADENHPKYHWHPNGCSEIKFNISEMTPLTVALFAYRAFNTHKFNKLAKVFKEKSDIVNNIYNDK